MGSEVPPAEDEPCALAGDVLLLVLRRLPPNEVSCTARLLCKETAAAFSSPQHRAVRLSQPIPPHAAAWRCGEEALKHLTFRGRLRVLSTAAAAGCEANLEVAWRLLGGGFFQELLPYLYGQRQRRPMPATVYHPNYVIDPLTAAVRAGHGHLLPWLAAHNCHMDLEEVAERCDLATLQQACALLHPAKSPCRYLAPAAARSSTPDALAKLQWLVEEHGCEVGPREVAAAASRGDCPCFRWLKQRGCDAGELLVYSDVLREADMELVQWARQQDGEDGAFAPWSERSAAHSAAGSAVEGVAKLRWLQACGVDMGRVGGIALRAAAYSGRLETVRYLVEECGVEVEQGGGDLASEMAANGDAEVMRYLSGRGVELLPGAYAGAARRGDVEMVRWLLREGCTQDAPSVMYSLIQHWPLGGNPGASASATEDCRAAVAAAMEAGLQCDGEQLVKWAAQSGSLPLVRWLVEERGCEVPVGALSWAASGGSAAVVEWLVARGCCLERGRAYADAASHADLATLRLLRQLRVPWYGRALSCYEMVNCQPAVLQWLADNGMALDRRKAVKALEVVEDEGPGTPWLQALLQQPGGQRGRERER